MSLVLLVSFCLYFGICALSISFCCGRS